MPTAADKKLAGEMALIAAQMGMRLHVSSAPTKGGPSNTELAANRRARRKKNRRARRARALNKRNRR